MRWPATVLASVAFDAGFSRFTAPTAVAVAVAATNGDDAYIGRWPTGDRYAYVGAWAIPWDQLEATDTLNPWRLRDCARIALRLTGPDRDDWSWSVVWRQGIPEAVWATARAAVDHPARGVADMAPGPVTALVGLSDALQYAEGDMHRQVSAVAGYNPYVPRL